MTVLEQLKAHELDQLDAWLDYSGKETKAFLKQIVAFAKENIDQLEAYCAQVVPTEFSSLSIVYQALSEHSVAYNDLLFKEVKRVVTLAKSNQIKPEYLEVLTEIETEDIYSKTEDIFVAMVSFMVATLNVQLPPNFNVELLDVIDWFVIDLDQDDNIPEAQNWIDILTDLAKNADPKTKVKAREVLETMDVDIKFEPLSFKEKLKRLF